GAGVALCARSCPRVYRSPPLSRVACAVAHRGGPLCRMCGLPHDWVLSYALSSATHVVERARSAPRHFRPGAQRRDAMADRAHGGGGHGRGGAQRAAPRLVRNRWYAGQCCRAQLTELLCAALALLGW